jgi:hypothetical protein
MPADTIGGMNDFRSMARDPEHRRGFEKLLYLAATRGDADLVAERLSWGIDPNCSSPSGRTPLIANVRGSSPSAATVRASLDENDQLRLDTEEQQELDEMRRELPAADRDFLHIWWQERLRAARRMFNDPAQIEQIVTILESAGGK